MQARTPIDLEQKTQAVQDVLTESLRRYGRLAYANSLGAEAVVLTDLIASRVPEIDVFTIDTGRLHEETYELLEKLQRRYGHRIRVVYPDGATLERLIARQGVNGFYHSHEARVACCHARKLEPFRRAVAGFAGWITGIRREQSTDRARTQSVKWDSEHSLYKISPLLEWTEADVWSYIRQHGLPYNRLHDRGYPSIGCVPCTRAIQPGESARAGRWWWERSESRECGLHGWTSPQQPIPLVAAST